MTDAPREVPEAEARLLLKGQVYGLYARLLSPAVREADRAEALERLRAVLAELGHAEALAPLEGVETAGTEGEYVRLFVRGQAPPYETSYESARSASGGQTHQMADIAGFYGAFGMRVEGERPDNIVPELEFVALLHVKEAYARLSGETEGAQVCADSRAKFMREHLLPWLPAFRERVSKESQHPALIALADSAATAVIADGREMAGSRVG